MSRDIEPYLFAGTTIATMDDAELRECIDMLLHEEMQEHVNELVGELLSRWSCAEKKAEWLMEQIQGKLAIDTARRPRGLRYYDAELLRWAVNASEELQKIIADAEDAGGGGQCLRGARVLIDELDHLLGDGARERMLGERGE